MSVGLISFSCSSPSASWAPSVNPKRDGGYTQGKELFQPRGWAGPDFYSYSHGENNLRMLEWEMLPDADLTTLLTFLGLVKGSPFAFTDYDATVYSVSKVMNIQSFPYRHRTLTHHTVRLELRVA